MNTIRFGSALVGAMCLAGTVLAQNNPLRGDDQPYAVRLTRLDDESSRNNFAWEDSGPANTPTSPVMKSAVRSVTQEKDSSAPPVPQKSNSSANTGSNSSNSYDTAMKGDCCENCLPKCCNNDHWYAYVGGLTMGRDTPNKFWTTFDQTNPAHQLLYFPGADWGGGVDTRIGYWFGCGCGNDPCSGGNSCGAGGRYGVEVVYWGMWGLDGMASVNDTAVGANQLGTVQDDGLVSFGANAVSDWFDDATRVVLKRNDEFHDVEINLMYMPCCDACNRLQLTALAGIRYFRFSEGLEWDQFGGSGLPVGADDEAILTANVQNNLIGFQIGTYMNYKWCNRVGLFAVPKIGIYGNHIVGHNSLFNDGTVATFDANGHALDFNNTKDVFSTLASLDVGMNWDMNQTWSLVAGYRVVLATDMALGDNQIPQFFADEAGWRTIKSNGDLLLHGAFAGLQARF